MIFVKWNKLPCVVHRNVQDLLIPELHILWPGTGSE